MSPLLQIWYPSSCFNLSDQSLRPLRLSHQHKILPTNPFQNLWTLWIVFLCPVLMVTLAKKKKRIKKIQTFLPNVSPSPRISSQAKRLLPLAGNLHRFRFMVRLGAAKSQRRHPRHRGLELAGFNLSVFLGVLEVVFVDVFLNDVYRLKCIHLADLDRKSICSNSTPGAICDDTDMDELM